MFFFSTKKHLVQDWPPPLTHKHKRGIRQEYNHRMQLDEQE